MTSLATEKFGDETVQIYAFIDGNTSISLTQIAETRSTPFPNIDLRTECPEEFDENGWRFIVRVFWCV